MRGALVRARAFVGLSGRSKWYAVPIAFVMVLTAPGIAQAHTVSTGLITVYEDSNHCLKANASIWEDLSFRVNISVNFQTTNTTTIGPITIHCNPASPWSAGAGQVRGRYILDRKAPGSSTWATCRSIAFTTGAGGINFGNWPEGSLSNSWASPCGAGSYRVHSIWNVKVNGVWQGSGVIATHSNFP